MATKKISDLQSALAIGASVLLSVLAMSALGIMAGMGIIGSALAFYVFPFILFVPTPRSWWFLSLAAAVLAALPAISFAVQVLTPSSVEGRTWSRETGWTPIAPPAPGDVLLTATIIASGLFVVILGALAFLKRVGVAAKPRGLSEGL